MHYRCAGNTSKTGPSTAANEAPPESIQNGANSQPSNTSPDNKDDESANDAPNQQLKSSDTRRRRLSVIPSDQVRGQFPCCVQTACASEVPAVCTCSTCSYSMLMSSCTKPPGDRFLTVRCMTQGGVKADEDGSVPAEVEQITNERGERMLAAFDVVCL